MSARPPRHQKKNRPARPAASRCPPRRRARNLRAGYKRATRPLFVRLFSLLALRALPLPPPPPPSSNWPSSWSTSPPCAPSCST